jgi:hypothetical protein
MTAELTICSVSYESRDWLRLNRRLLELVNPGAAVRWVVAENSAPGSAERLRQDDAGFEVVAGAPAEEHAHGGASYHHGAGLARALQEVKTRFLLVLDPDFLIVRRSWIRDVLEHMRQEHLALLGAPWHPSRPRKYRYFPCAHCTFVDLERIPLATLDFRPDHESEPDDASRDARSSWARLDPLDVGQRRRIGQSRDTGWRIFARYAGDPDTRVECLQPVFRPGGLRRALEWPLPDRHSLVPKRPGYFRESGFASAGLPDLEALGWEEFFWRCAPFGVHVRCHPIRLKRPDALATHLERARQLVAAL